MTHKKYMEDQDAEEPDDFIISLTAQVRLYTFLSDFILLGFWEHYIFARWF